MEVKKIVEGMTAQQVAQVIDDNFKAQNAILEEDITTQNSVIGVSEYKDFSEAEAVNVGDVRKYNGFLYECVEATTGAFDASKWKKSSFKNETEKKLSELGSEVYPFQMFPNMYIDANGNVNQIDDTWFCSGYISLTGLVIEAIRIQVNSNASTASYIAFYDKDFSFISGYNGSISVPLDGSYSITEMPTIPSEAKYVAFCSIRKPISITAYYNVLYGKHPLQKLLPVNPMILNERKRAMESETENLEYSKKMEYLSIISGQYIDPSGKVVPNRDWHSTAMIPLNNVVFNKISLRTNGKSSTASYIAFYNNNFGFISGYNGSISEDDNYIRTIPSIPSEAVYVKFCAYGDYPKVYVLYRGNPNVAVMGNSLDFFQYKGENDKAVNELKSKLRIRLYAQSYIDPNGVFTDETNPSLWFRTGYLHLTDLNIKSVEIKVNSLQSTASYVAFYDSEFNFISNIDGTKAESDLYIKAIEEIPSTAVYVAFCSIGEPLSINADYNGLELTSVEYVKEPNKENTQEYNKIAEKAVYIGDSISSTNPLYGGKPVGVLLQEWGIITNVEVLAVSGSKILGAIDQINSATTENPDIVFVATGVNDWAANVNGLGDWFNETTNQEGEVVRTYDVSSNTIKARYNKLYQAVRSKYPLARIIFSTVIKKANNSRQADYGYVYSPSYLEKNKESGLWLDDMRSAVLDMPRICQVEAMDMWSLCGLDPTNETQLSKYFYDKTHPNTEGHKLMTKAMYKYLVSH